MRNSPVPSCVLHKQVKGFCRFFFLISLSHILLFQVAVALPSRFPAVVTPPTSTSIENKQEPNVSVSVPSEVSKRLLDLNSCISDTQCWGRGRRCIEGRCWGFAGPRHTPFKCGAGSVCKLNHINGHFYGDGSRSSRGLFMLQAIRGPLTDCGTAGDLNKAALCEDESLDCVLSEAGDQRKISGFAALGDRDNFVVGAPTRCIYTPGITAQSACSARLGFIHSSIPVGQYALCGCSSTDLGANGQPCTSEADFSVPIGTLEITGFPSPAVSSSPPGVAAAAAVAAAPTGKEEKSVSVARKGEEAAAAAADTVGDTEPLEAVPSPDKKVLLLPRFSCTVGIPCELPGIRGHGLMTTEHFVRAFPGVHGSCEEPARTSVPLRLPCSAASGGTRCIVSVRPEDIKALMHPTAAADGKEKEASAVDVTLCGCRKGLRPTDCLGATLVGLLRLRNDEQPLQHQEEQQQQQQQQQQRQQQQHHSLQHQQAQKQPHQQLRKLQFIEDRAANLPEEDDPDAPVGGECQKHLDCLGGYGKCVSGRCRGFIPDVKEERLIRCVEGYHCDAGKGDIPTRGNKENFTVIAIGPDEECGAAVNLKPEGSIFNNANKWICSSSPSSSCELRFGVARRLNRGNTVEGLRLCGCPALDVNGDSLPCNHMRDFRVPLGRVSVQECITNAHCADRQLAYCIKDHCGGFLVSAAAAGVHAFACVRNQDCTIENVAARGVSEALKVIPIAAHLKCGSEAALDPNFLPESAMPCVADVDADGKCDVHLGVNHFFGTHRLCGCSGADVGGSGMGCDEAADFGVELGLLNTVECVVHSDCPIHSLCAKGECVSDDLPPTLVATEPSAGSIVVPPLKQIELQFNEDVVFGRPGASLVVACLSPDIKWVITLPEEAQELKIIKHNPSLFPRTPKRATAPAAESSGSSKWMLERQGQRLRVTPDEDLSSLPAGEYLVSLEFGFVTDLTGNPCEVPPPLSFTLARDAGCPLLYATGFATENGNTNGLYTPIDPVNNHAAWRGAEGNAFFIYYRKETEGEPGNWVLDTDLDESAFLGFADLSLLTGGLHEGSRKAAGPSVPPTGLWHKWTGKKKEEQPFVAFICRDTADHVPPTLTDVHPPSKSAAGGPHLLRLDSTTAVPLEPITLVFNKPINYGHWAALRLIPRGSEVPVAEWVTDQEAGMRGEGGSVLIRSPSPPSKKASRKPQGAPGASQEPQGQPEGSEGAGVVELLLEEPLEGGKEYDLVADLGAFTDFSYNPWGPLAPQTVTFLAAATHCPLRIGAAAAAAAAEAAEPDGPEAQAAAGDETSYEMLTTSPEGDPEGRAEEKKASPAPEGTVATVRCAAGLAVPSDLAEGDSGVAGVLRCKGGKWEGPLIPCVPVCGPYPALGDAYEIEDLDEVAEEGLSGVSVTIRCAGAVAGSAQQQQQQQTVTCHGGKWGQLSLKCAASCPPLKPSLGRNYDVFLPDVSAAAAAEAIDGETGAAAAGPGEMEAAVSAREGEERIVECSISSVPSNPEMQQQIVRCTAQGWMPEVTLSCKGACRYPPISPEGAKLQGEGLHHGSVWTAECLEGYAGPPGVSSAEFVCEDGLWVRHQSEGSPFSCAPVCPSLTLNPTAYKVTPIAAAAGAAAGAAANQVQIECAEGSLLLGGPPSEVLKCERGLWGLRSTTCAASCLNPIEELGKHYSLLQQQQQQQELYRHGETVDITCTENQSSSPTAASKPHTITCVDGVWQSAPHVPRQQQQQDPDVPPAAGSSSSSSSGVSLRCSATCGLPPLAAHFSILSSTGRGPPRGPLKSVWREGEKLFVGCSPPFDASLLLPAGAREQRLQQQEQQQQVLQCRDGAWVGELKDSVCVRPCPGAPDGPPASKWKELGVACGAPCSSRCGSCYNGKRDKEEEGVDCGGPFCLPCSSCSPFPLKQFVLQPRLYSSSIKQQQRQQQQTDFPVEFTQHGSKISFSCVSSPALSLRVICSNGRWTAAGVATAAPAAGTAAEDAARLSAFAAACVQADVRASEASSSSSSSASGAARPRAISAATAASERMDEELLLVGAAAGAAGVEHPLQWREPELLRFGAPLLRPFPAIPQQHQQQQQQQQQQLSPCVSELVAAVSRLLVGECGALAFGGSSFKVASFCKGTCSATYKQQLQQARECSSKTAAAIAAADPTAAAAVKDQQLLQQFEQLLQVFCEVYEGKHCFAEAGDTLELLQRLHQTPLLLQQLRQQACPGSSGEKCFSSNIRYISVLQQLRQHVDLQLPGMQQQDQQQHAAAAAAAAQRGKGSQEGLIDVGVKGLLTDLGRLPAITSLLCAEVEGQSCAPQVLSLGTQNPFAALPAPEAAATFCSSNPAAPCLLEAYRLVGQKLLQPPPQQQQQQELHPYDWTLGTAMLSVGRNFCLRSAEDQTCGALLLPAAVTDAAKAAAAAEDRPYVPASAAELPRCTCPLAFVGDGECDSSCNTAACAFDRGDCLAQNQLLLQPLMESLEANTIPRGDTCFPFLQGFDCRRKDCRLTMQELQSRHGCCFASQVELLRDLLAIDEQQQQQQRQQLQLLLQQAPEAVTPQLMHLIETDWEAAGSGGPPMEYYRSIAFLEADCKMQLDRTCSRGLNRFAFAVDATLEGLRHEALKTSSSIGSGSREEEALRHVLRDILAAAFGVPLGDVLLVRLWRGLDVHAVIDTGPLSNKAHFLQTVETLRSDGPSGLASLLLTELKRQEAAATTAHKQQLLVPQQQQPWGPLSLHRVPLLLEASVFSPPVSVPPSELTISQIAFSSPGSSSINSSSRRQQEQQEHQPEKGTWGLGTIIPKDVPCSTNGGLSAPPNVSVFEVYRLHSSSSVNPHGSVITVECGRGYSPVSGSSPQQLICQQGRWGPKEGPPGAPPERILRCRKPCGPYESSDPLVLGPAFVTSGLGETDGDKRAIYCASGFVAAAAAMPKTDSVVCTNGSWSRRQLECIKDFSAIADSSPCASSLSLLPPSLKVETIQMGGGSGTGPGGSPGVSSEVAAALAATFQRAGVSLQLFRVGCARGFVAAPTHQQQQQQPFAYAACKDGMLLDLGSQDPLPMGAFASGEAAEALVQQLKLRVEAAPEATAAEAAASETETEEETSSVADVPLLVDGDAAAAAMKGSLKGPMVLGASLGCERELRQEPAKVPKPVSDTLLVFVCLLLLFVLVVALLLFWWMRARHREKKAAKQQQQQLDHQQDDDPRAETSSGIGGGLISPSEGQAASYLGLGPAMPPFGGILQQQQRVTNNAALYEQQGTMGGSLSYPLDGEGQQRSRQRGGVCSGPPLFPSEEAAAAAAEVDEHSLALYAPVYYTGLSGDKGLVRDDNESSFSGAADAARPLNEAEMLRRMEQQQVERKMLQQHSAAAAARRGELRPTDAFRVRGHNAAAVSTACIAAAAADQQQQHVHAAAAWGSHQQTGGRGSLPGYQEPNEPLRQPQQLRQQQQLLHAVSRKAKASSDGAVGATGDSALTSGGGQLSEEEELYPDDSASCVAMTANQRREAGGGAAGALATSTGGALRVPKSRAGAHKHLSAAQGQSNGRAARIALPSLESVHRRHAQA